MAVEEDSAEVNTSYKVSKAIEVILPVECEWFAALPSVFVDSGDIFPLRTTIRLRTLTPSQAVFLYRQRRRGRRTMTDVRILCRDLSIQQAAARLLYISASSPRFGIRSESDNAQWTIRNGRV